MKSTTITFLSALFFSLMALSSAMAAETVGMIERLKGPASRADTGGESQLTAGSKIMDGDILRTGNGARMIVRFDDNSWLTMGENAEMIVDGLI
mgnify:FL=1